MAKKRKNGLKYKPNINKRIGRLLGSSSTKKQQKGVSKMNIRLSKRLK